VEDPDAGDRRELTAPERRILGCLVEKERATPQNYPLTLNSLRLACNQATNRDPVTDYDDATLEEALVSLRQQGLTRIVYSTSNRAAKYRHVLEDVWRLDAQELAVIAVLLLRGPQTVGELKGRTERLADFADLGAVQTTLEGLATRTDGPFVVRHERRPGQKDARWAHLLGGADEEPAWAPPTSTTVDDGYGYDHRYGPDPDPGPVRASPEIAELTAEVSRLRSELEALRGDFETFRAEFG
jgi:uncharacterized protein YceH (UPF0502 family)